MKKINILSIILIIMTVLFFVGCTVEIFDEEEEGDASISIITPKDVPIGGVLQRSIGGVTNEQIEDLKKRIRYEIGIEYRGRRIRSLQLNSNDTVTLNVPAGVRLSFGVGAYLADSNSSNNELWNVYIVSDVIDNVVLMPGETRYLDFTLDFRRPARVESYFPPLLDAPGMNDAPGTAFITGGVVNAASDLYFTYINLKTFDKGFVEYAGGAFTSEVASPPVGKIFKVNDVQGANDWWFVGLTNIYKNDGSSATFGSTFGGAVDPGSIPYLRYVYSIKDIEIDASNAFYFLNYGEGMLTTRYFPLSGGWWSLNNVSFSNFSYIYPELPFLFDIAQDDPPDETNSFFVSKIGCFYVDYATLLHFAEGRKREAIARLKKLIRIPHPRDPRISILITSVKISGRNIFLGTRDGLYRIKKDSEWRRFVNLPLDRYTILSPDRIEKIVTFDSEPVTSIELSGPNGDILAVTTPRRVWFKNLSTGKTDTITVWDGLPFIPMRSLSFEPNINLIDFREHDVSQVMFVLWDNTNSKFWIGTKHGLASIALSDLF